MSERSGARPGNAVRPVIEQILIDTGYSQGELADLLGVSDQYLADIKHGRRPITAGIVRSVRQKSALRGYYPTLIKAILEDLGGLAMPFHLDPERPAQVRLGTILALLWDDLPEDGAKRLAKAAWSEYERQQRDGD